MGQQMTQGDFVCAVFGRTAEHETGQEGANGCIEIEAGSLVEQHRHCSGCNNLGDAREVEDGLRGYLRGRVFIGEMTECVGRQNFTTGENTKGASGKSLCCYGVFENGGCGREAFVRVDLGGILWSGLCFQGCYG